MHLPCPSQRKILRYPELPILDESPMALNSQSERLVQESIERFGLAGAGGAAAAAGAAADL